MGLYNPALVSHVGIPGEDVTWGQRAHGSDESTHSQREPPTHSTLGRYARILPRGTVGGVHTTTHSSVSPLEKQ